jgi:hypothetical protein
VAELKIPIVSTADTKGVVQTEQALKQLDLTASKTYNNIAVAQAKTEVAEKSATDESKAANQERAQSALKQIEAAEKVAEKAKLTAAGLKDVGKATKELSQLGRDAGDVLSGLSRGGLDGLQQAGKGAGNVIKTLASGTLGAVFIPVVAAAAAGLVYLNKKAAESERAIAKTFESHAKAVQLYQTRLAELTAASAKDFDAQVKHIEKLSTAYDEVTAAIDRAYARQKKLDDANSGLNSAKLDSAEKRELAAAKTPEQQAAIKQKFSDQRLVASSREKFNQFDTIDLESKRHEEEAAAAQREAADVQRTLSLRAEEAERVASEKSGAVDVVTAGMGRRGLVVTDSVKAEREKLVKEALAARDAATAAKTQAEEAALKLDATNKKLTDAQVTGRDTREVNAINRNAFRETLSGRQIDAQAGANDLQKTLGKKVAGLQPGDEAGLKEIQSLRTQIAAQKATAGTIGGLLNGDTKNQSTAGIQQQQREQAGIIAPKIAGADGKPEGGSGSITKDGETIKVTGASTVAELKKTSTVLADSSKEIAKAAPLLTKNAAENAKVIASYHSSVVNAFQAQNQQIAAQQKQIDELARAVRAKADRS